jgi:ribosomal protein L12E/L44/L45/RPP1/RPP2
LKGIPLNMASRARVDIDPEALKILKALADLEGQSPSDYLSALIMREGASVPEAVKASKGETGEKSGAEEREREEAEARWREFRRTKIGD